MDVNDEALFVEWENDTIFNNFPDDSFLNSHSDNHGSGLKNQISPEKKNCYVDVDLDYAIAMSLQKEFNEEVKENANNNSKKYDASKPLSIVDEQWELIDPHPDIHALFVEYDARFFYGKLKCVEVRWSPRMTLCAGICSYQGRGGLCSIGLSQPLLKLRPRRDLVETLLHEMIHAYLFVTENNRDRDGHGPEFLSHMYRINREAGTKITVYHSFHAEVNLYKQHWWKCDGPCKSQAPYFGLVKRAMNRAPGPNDNWWAAHQLSCGGKFIKIKEPSNFKEKKLPKRKLLSDPKSKPSDIRKFATSNDEKKGNKELGQMNILSIESHVLGTQKTSSPNKDSVGVINAIGMPEMKNFIPFQGPGHKLGISSRFSHVSSDISSRLLKDSDLKGRTDFPSSLSRMSDIKESPSSPRSVLTKKVATSSSARKTPSKGDAHSSSPKKTKTIEELFSNSHRKESSHRNIRKFATSNDEKRGNKELGQMNILGIESHVLGTQKTSSPNKDSVGVINAIGMPEKKNFIPFHGPGHKLGISSRFSHVSSDISSRLLKDSDLKGRTDFPSSLSRKSDIKESPSSPRSVLTKKVATSSSVRKTPSKGDAHSSSPKKTKTIEELFSNSHRKVLAQKGTSSLSRKFETVISPRFAEIQRKPSDTRELQSGLDNASKASSSKIKLSENNAVKNTSSSQNRCTSDANFSSGVSTNLYCPVCCNLVTEEINAHLDKCLKNSTL